MKYYVGDTVTWQMDQTSPDGDTYVAIWKGVIISEALRPDRTTVFEVRVLETEHSNVSGFRYECRSEDLVRRSVAHEPRKVASTGQLPISTTQAFVQRIAGTMRKRDQSAPADRDSANLEPTLTDSRQVELGGQQQSRPLNFDVGEQVTWCDSTDTGFEIGDEHSRPIRIGTIIAEHLIPDGTTEYEVEVELVAGRFDPRIKVVRTAAKLEKVGAHADIDGPFRTPLELHSADARLPRQSAHEEPVWKSHEGGRFVVHVEDQPGLYTARVQTYDQALLRAYRLTRERLLKNGCGDGLVFDSETRQVLAVLGYEPDPAGQVDAGIMTLPSPEQQQRMVEIIELVDRGDGGIHDFIWQTWSG